MNPNWFLGGMFVAIVLAWAVPGPGAHGGWLHPEALTKAGVVRRTEMPVNPRGGRRSGFVVCLPWQRSMAAIERRLRMRQATAQLLSASRSSAARGGN